MARSSSCRPTAADPAPTAMEIRVEPHGPHVAVVTIDNQPRRNAMTRQMMAELAAQWDALERASYRCIVLTGAGDRAFSSGADLAGEGEIARGVVLQQGVVDDGGQRNFLSAHREGLPCLHGMTLSRCS